MAHHFASRFRVLVERELPDVLDGLVAAGAHLYNPLDHLEAGVRGPDTPGDADFAVVTARRVVVEAVVDTAASTTTGLRIRRGDAVAGLVAGPPDPAGIPSVVGVRLESGEELPCDLVVDAGVAAPRCRAGWTSSVRRRASRSPRTPGSPTTGGTSARPTEPCPSSKASRRATSSARSASSPCRRTTRPGRS